MSKPLPLFDHQLRDYQKDAQVAIRKAFKSGDRATICEMPTGCGKTRMFCTLPKEGARVLIIVPFISLVSQTVSSIRHLRQVEADIEQAHNSALPESDFVVASWASLHSNGRYKKFLNKVDLIVVDECHHGFTVESRDMLKEFVDQGAYVLGVTATAYRSDKTSLLGFYDSVAYTYGLRQAIDDGYLVGPRCMVHYVKSIDLKGLAKRSGTEFQAEELDRIMRQEEVTQEIAALFNKQHVRGAKAIMFCHSIKQATQMQVMIESRFKIRTSLVHSYMPPDERQEQLDAFMTGDNELIVNVGVLAIGWDYPKLSEGYFCKPCKSLNRYTQQVGRLTRTVDNCIADLDTPEERKAAIAASGKPYFTVHDLTDSSRCHKLQTCIDVLAGQHGEVVKKIKRKAEEVPMEMEEIDKAVADEIAAEKEQLRLAREEEIQRRKKIVVGMEFSAEERDLFLDPDRDTPKRREFRMIWGKYKGQPLRNINLGYLEWAHREGKLTPFWKKAIGDHINFRRSVARRDAERGGSWTS